MGEVRATGGGGESSDDTSPQRWVLYALDAASGRVVWEQTADQGAPRDKRHVKSTYASSTPATDGRVVVAWFGSHGLRAYTVDGTPLWAVNVGRVSAGAAAGRTFRHLATNDIGEPVMATPALSRGLIYVRGKNSLFAIGQQTKR